MRAVDLTGTKGADGGGGGGGAPADATYLVATADPTLTNEIPVGATPGGELGNTWASPTVDAAHSGSTHAATQAAAEATAASAMTTHKASADDHPAYALDSDLTTHAAAADPHTGYLKESNTIDFLVGTATAELAGEIVVGATPGGELGGTWASPTVDAAHSGSTHAATQAAAEATAAAADAAHVAAAHPHASMYATGAFSARGSAATRGAGFIYLETDCGVAFISDGTNWQQLSPGLASTLAAVITFNATSQAANTPVVVATFQTIPANYVAVGTTFKYEVGFDIDVINSATARNLTVKLRLGSTVISTLGHTFTVSVGQTAAGGYLSGMFTFHAIGASGLVRAQDERQLNTGGVKNNSASSATAGVTIDTTASQVITVTLEESANSVADLFRSETGYCRVMKV